MFPPCYRPSVNGLAHLRHARGADRPCLLMKLQASGIPCQATPGNQLSRHSLQVRHRLFVVDFQNGHRQHLPPVIHDTPIVEKASGDVLLVASPADVTEVGHPARDRDIAQVPAAMDDSGVREQCGNQSQIEIVVRHLVHHAIRRAVEFAEASEVPRCELLRCLTMEPGQGLNGRGVGFHEMRDRIEIHRQGVQFAGTEHLGMAGQDLLGQSGP